jgi:hypothetical protein
MKVRWGRVILALGFLVFLCGGLALVFSRISGSDVADRMGEGIDKVAQQAADLAKDEASPAKDNRTRDGRDTASGDGQPYGGPDANTAGDGSGLPPFRVLTLAYTPYMATLVHMEAGGYLERLGYDLQLFDVYDEAVGLDETDQCLAVSAGEYQALATTLDATRKCGEGVGVGIPIGQSAGNDAIIVKPGVDTWSEIFEHAIAFTDGSVSEYMACFASHSASQPIQLAVRKDDAPEAVDDWINAGSEQNILSVVAWEPEVSRALAAVPGSQVILSSADVRILWDVIEFSRLRVDEDPAPYLAFSEAYYRALADLTRDPQAALARILQWAGDDEGRLALLTTTAADAFIADLDNEAFATLRDAQILMQEETSIVNRLEEAAFYWNYCGVEVPAVVDERLLILPQFVEEVGRDEALRGRPNERPSGKVFQVTDFTDAGAVSDRNIEAERVLFQTGVEIEFLANRTDFRNPVAALATLENAVRFLRTCQDCVLEVQGGAAYPGSRLCPSCTAAESDQLAIQRGERVHRELIQQFDVPDAQLRFVDTPHTPQFPDSNDEEQLRQDRRTFLTGLQLGGR